MKIIIHFNGVSSTEALSSVALVMEKGRISNKNTQFCYCTKFDNGIDVYADRTSTGTDTFTVMRCKD